MPDRSSPDRRRFLKAAAVTSAALTVVPRHVLGGPGVTPPSEQLNVATIGVGGQGYADTRSMQQLGHNIVAIAEVDQRNVARALQQFPKARVHVDFRKMLDGDAKDIDAVIVATPDHLHAVATMAAMKAGKHVYCQKPLTHTVGEARAIRAAAGKYKVATQMGNQRQASETSRLISEMIWDGAIGNVKEVHAGCNRKPDISPRGIARPADAPPVPGHINWDLWVGPAPMRPYHPSYFPFNWRGWWNFGSGVLGDMGCHLLFDAFRTLNLGPPTRIEPCSSNWQLPDAISKETAPLSAITRFKFPAGKMANGADHGPIEIVWYDGGMKPPRPEEMEPERLFGVNDFTMFVGDQGKMYEHRLLPDARMKGHHPPRVMERSPGHYQEWAIACKGGKPAGSNFADSPAATVTETLLLGNIALRTNQILEYDPARGEFTNSKDANALLNPPYRDGWSL